jgi:hypothetical protein
MIKNQLVVLLPVLLICVFSCGESDALKQEQLHDKVMKVHNEVMPKLAELNRLKRQLKSFKDIASDENTVLKDSLINGILLLSKSEDLMTDWMAKYDYPNDSLKHEVMIIYLSGQIDSIENIARNFNMSLAIAQSFLKNAPDSIKNNGVKKK